MKRYLLLLVLIIQLVRVNGQSTTGQTFTLEQCVSYALNNSVTMKNSKVDEQIADARVKETRGIGLPQIDASVGLQHNPKLQRMFFEKTPDNFFLAEVPGLNNGDVVAQANQFQLKSSGNAALSINQILFNSSYLVGLKAANTYRELSVRNTEATTEEVIQNVSKAYYLCLINNDRVKLFETNIARVDSLYKNTKAMFENGFAESIDVDRIKVSLNNLKVEQSEFLNLQEIALYALKFQMNYPLDQPLNLSGDISSIEVDTLVLKNYAIDWDYSQRSDYRLLETNRKLQSLDIKNKYSESLPSLNAFANLGYMTQSASISGIFKTETDVSSEASALGFGADKWYSYSTIGISLNIPIFSGLQRNYRIQQAKLNLLKIENNFSQLKSGIDLEIKQSATAYLNAVNSANAQKENMDLASNVARITRIKYEQGVCSNFEVVDAETALREAQINYYSALYDAVVAKIDLDKAYGKLKGPETTEAK
jgi:outer membrane protein TolC